jgi:hypothetical protein
LLAEKGIAPLGVSELIRSKERVIRHPWDAHHDGNQFA